MQAKPLKTQPTAVKPAAPAAQTTATPIASKKMGVVRKTLNSPSVRRHPFASATMLISVCLLAFAGVESAINTRSRTVIVTAYTSSPAETDSTPYLPACGGELVPGDRAVAVSRDLEKQGIKCGMSIWIDGVAYQIDIYAGDDKQAAKAFGKRRLTVKWRAA